MLFFNYPGSSKITKKAARVSLAAFGFIRNMQNVNCYKENYSAEIMYRYIG